MEQEKYSQLQGTLSLKFETDTLELLQVGVLGLHLHEIVNQVAITELQVADELQHSAGKPQLLTFIPQTYERQDKLIKIRLASFRQGSVEMDLNALVNAVASHPGAVAILTNLLSNAIWAIGTYAARVPGVFVRWKSGEGREFAGLLFRPKGGRKKLRPKIDKFVRLLAESSHGGRLYLKANDVEFEIEFDPPARKRAKTVEDS